jgi:uncharacterized SAM-binding protein YcdF (DUF218 family)
VFVLLSKILDLAVSPLSWVLALLLAALLLRRRGGISALLVVLAIGVLYVFSTSRVANALMESLESSARNTARPGAYDAVIVLSGMVDDASSSREGRVELTSAADRIVAGFELLREGRARHILISGGAVWPQPGVPTEPEWLAGALRRWGVEPGRIVLETRSRNTHENAVESARIVAERGWGPLLLVTSAFHMKRALGCFRRVGLSPDTYPVDYRGEHDLSGWAPRAQSFAQSTDVLREYTGRLVYRLVGYT